MSDIKLEPALSVPSSFRFGEVSSQTALRKLTSSAPNLGPLADFSGNFEGNGFNTIFRPNTTATPTPLPIPPIPPHDNVLELNLTVESLSFSKSLGSVPNRGMVQGDIFLNGVPYLQTISDVTVPSQPTGIHFEPGLWLAVAQTGDPAEGPTLVRMASIPHGTTVVAQGTSSTSNGKPTIPSVDITPFKTGSPGSKFPFPSQTAASNNTERIPQDLRPFILAGTITQAMLTDPNIVLRNHIATQNIISTTTISIATNPGLPLFAGGTDNIAFLMGDPTAANPNAQTVNMLATFWIETVEHTILVPPFRPGRPPLIIAAETGEAGQPAPRFLINPPIPIPRPIPITFLSIQIQYSQQVFLNFNTLTWPHVSVATLVPADPIPIPPSVWA
jgi:hypothetical protein